MRTQNGPGRKGNHSEIRLLGSASHPGGYGTPSSEVAEAVAGAAEYDRIVVPWNHRRYVASMARFLSHAEVYSKDHRPGQGESQFQLVRDRDSRQSSTARRARIDL